MAKEKKKAKTTLSQKIFLLFFGLGVTLVLLETGLRLSGVVFYAIQDRSNRVSLKQGGEYRIMCLGESTTALGGVDSYPSQLEEILNARSPKIRFSVINKGRPHSTTGTILSRLDMDLEKYHPQMVVVMMGINDAEYTHIPVTVLAKARFLCEKLKIVYLGKLLYWHIVDNLEKTKQHILPKGSVENPFDTSEDTYSINKINDISEADKVLGGLIARLTKSYRMYVNAADLARKKNDGKAAQDYDKKAKAINEAVSAVYAELGGWHRRHGDPDTAQQLYKKALELDPQDWAAFGEWGEYLADQKKIDEAIVMFKKALSINPQADWVLIGLGRSCSEAGKYNDAVEAYRQVLKIKPSDYWINLEFGQWLRQQKRFDEAREIFLKAANINPKNYLAYDEIGQSFLDEKRYVEARETFQKAVKIFPQDDRPYSALANCYLRENNKEKAQQYLAKAEQLKLNEYYPLTIRHYSELADKVLARDIKLVCMQYPLREVEPLKKILEPHHGIIFVDNKKIFTDALKTLHYDEYFKDSFAGDFGHCTRKGNRLVAKNLAGTILQNVLSLQER